MFIFKENNIPTSFMFIIILSELKIKNYFNQYNYLRAVGDQTFKQIYDLVKDFYTGSRKKVNKLGEIKDKLEQTGYSRFMTDQVIPKICYPFISSNKPFGIIDNLGLNLYDLMTVSFVYRSEVKYYRLTRWTKKYSSQSPVKEIKDNMVTGNLKKILLDLFRKIIDNNLDELKNRYTYLGKDISEFCWCLYIRDHPDYLEKLIDKAEFRFENPL